MNKKSRYYHYVARADQVLYINIAEQEPDERGERLAIVRFTCGHDLHAAIVAFDGLQMILATVEPWKSKCQECILAYYGEDNGD